MKIQSKLSLLSFVAFLFLQRAVQAQNNVGVNTPNPHATAALDVTSTDKGMLVPRLTLAQRNNIALNGAPAVGLLIYQTDNTPGFYYFDNLGNWTRINTTTSGFSLPYAGSTGTLNPFIITNPTAASGSSAITGISTSTPAGIGVKGTSNGNNGVGVSGTSSDINGIGVEANNTANGVAIKATSAIPYTSLGAIVAQNTGSGNALKATTTSSSISFAAVDAENNGGGIAVKGLTSSSTSGNSAILGTNTGSAGFGIKGISNAANTAGVRGESTNGVGVNGYSEGATAVLGSSVSGTAIKGNSTSGYALQTVGDLQFSGGNTSPSIGAVLTSTDAVGNAVWKKSRVGFCVRNAVNTVMPNNTTTKVEFNSENYDLQNNFVAYAGSTTAGSSKFTAPVAGIYNFSSTLYLFITSATNNFYSASIQLVVNGTSFAFSKGTITNSAGSSRVPLSINTSVHLNAGDQVWIEVFQGNDSSDPAGFLQGSPDIGLFSGNLLFAD